MLKIVFVGDICLAPGMPDGLLREIKSATDADILVGNIECAITDQAKPVLPKYASLIAHPDMIRKLDGLDVGVLANNHVGDFGPGGVRDTIRHLKDAGIQTVGYGEKLPASGSPLSVVMNGVKLAFCAFSCYTTNGKNYADSANEGVSPLFHDHVVQSIRNACIDHDVVTAIFHWGVEHTHFPVYAQMSMARHAIEAGAHAVIGGHPHVIQPAEQYAGRPICYSLGNLYFPDIRVTTGGSDDPESSTVFEQKRPNKEAMIAGLVVDADVKKVKCAEIRFFAVSETGAQPLVVDELSFDYERTCRELSLYRRLFAGKIFAKKAFSLISEVGADGVTHYYDRPTINVELTSRYGRVLVELFVALQFVLERLRSRKDSLFEYVGDKE